LEGERKRLREGGREGGKERGRDGERERGRDGGTEGGREEWRSLVFFWMLNSEKNQYEKLTRDPENEILRLNVKCQPVRIFFVGFPGLTNVAIFMSVRN